MPSGWLSEAYEAVVAASEDEPRVYHVLTFFDSDMDTDDAELLEGVQGWNFRFQVIDMNAELGVTKRERKRSKNNPCSDRQSCRTFDTSHKYSR